MKGGEKRMVKFTQDEKDFLDDLIAEFEESDDSDDEE